MPTALLQKFAPASEEQSKKPNSQENATQERLARRAAKERDLHIVFICENDPFHLDFQAGNHRRLQRRYDPADVLDLPLLVQGVQRQYKPASEGRPIAEETNKWRCLTTPPDEGSDFQTALPEGRVESGRFYLALTEEGNPN